MVEARDKFLVFFKKKIFTATAMAKMVSKDAKNFFPAKKFSMIKGIPKTIPTMEK